MAGRGGGSNTTHALVSPDPETLPKGEGVPLGHRRVTEIEEGFQANQQWLSPVP